MGKVELISEEVSKIWSGWEVRMLILLSLLLQVILILFGSQRKNITGMWIKSLVWIAYMSADFVATVALGNLAKIQIDSDDDCQKPIEILQAFWAPFLLLHLGGPDTITAYSLEDNELWLRHFLGLIVQVGVACYVIFWSWSNTAIKFMAVPILIIGAIKYGERTYVLWSASTKQFKEALLHTNPFAENATRITMGIKEEGFFESKIPREDARERQQLQHSIDDAYFLFKRFKYLFAGLTLGLNERTDCYKVIHQAKAEHAFKLVATELGFLYDVLYTKATITYSRFGPFFRVFIFVTSVSILVVFPIFINLLDYPDLVDISVTYILLAGAVFLEVYAFIVLLLSDWTNLWMFKQRTQHFSLFRLHSHLADRKRWSGSVAQLNLISFCLEDVQGIWFAIYKLPYISKLLHEYPYLTWKHVSADLEEAIFEQLQQKGNTMKDNYTIKSCKELLAHRGDYVLEKRSELKALNWSIVALEFDHSLLVWHIATEICYCLDFDSTKRSERTLLQNRKISKCLSDYMLYLLALLPSMLPEGIGEIRYRDTCTQVKQFLKMTNCGKSRKQLCKKLYDDIGRRPINQSVLSDGCKLAKELQSLKLSPEEKWSMISEVWVEMLAYAANHCGWKEHAQQLWKGGELLTHVCLLMTHLGLSEHYTEVERFFFM